MKNILIVKHEKGPRVYIKIHKKCIRIHHGSFGIFLISVGVLFFIHDLKDFPFIKDV